jgi:hypothetical protein
LCAILLVILLQTPFIKQHVARLDWLKLGAFCLVLLGISGIFPFSHWAYQKNTGNLQVKRLREGLALPGLGRFDPDRPAFNPARAITVYNSGSVYARLNQMDEAARYMRQVTRPARPGSELCQEAQRFLDNLAPAPATAGQPPAAAGAQHGQAVHVRSRPCPPNPNSISMPSTAISPSNASTPPGI